MSSLNYFNHWEFFLKERNESLAQISDPTNNLIIRLDKLIQRHTLEWQNRKEFEKHVVSWDAINGVDSCDICKSRFTITRRIHHCRLCGSKICALCSQFLSFESAERLTGIKSSVVSSSLLALINGDDHFGGGLSLSVDKTINPNTSKNFAMPTLGSSLYAMKQSVKKLGAIRSIVSNRTAENNERSLRICGNCKNLLDRRERTMDLRIKNDPFYDIYLKMCGLLSQFSQLASAYRPMAISLNNGETLYSLTSASTLRLKLKNLQEEILRISSMIEQWGPLDGDPIPHAPSSRELQLQKNIRMLALHTLHEMVNIGLDLPSTEEYELKKNQNRQRLQRQIKRSEDPNVETEQGNSSNNFIKSANSILTKKMGNKRSSASFSSIELPEPTRGERSMRQSSSFTALKNEDDSWMPHENPIVEQKQNPFKQKELENWHPLQEQLVILKSFLRQAAIAGRTEEMHILERNLRELEQELEKAGLQIPEEIE